MITSTPPKSLTKPDSTVSVTSKSPSVPRPKNQELWNHCMYMILVLDKDGKEELKRGGIRSMLNMFHIMTKLEKYDSRHTDLEYPTIVSVQ